MIAGQLALVVASLFSGAAVYVLAVERVARQQLDDRAALTEWKPSYKRGAAMQAPLALIGFVLGTVAWWQTSNPWFLAGALALLAPWPWTLLAIKPTNEKLLATPIDAAGTESRAVMEKWGRLHAVRVLLGAGATVLFFAAIAFA
jgi:hypothetical protein